MESKTAIGLTPKDIAILADGQGNIPDDTAGRLAIFIRGEERAQGILQQLAQMAADAGVEQLADGHDTFESLSRLRQEPWESVIDVLDPRLDVPYPDLISMAGALADRAEGTEHAELRQLERRLILELCGHLAGEKFVALLIQRLLQFGEPIAEEALDHLVRHYRLRRQNGAGEIPRERGGEVSHVQAG